MRWYKDRPDEGDFVVITLSDVDKNSAYANLDEYEDVKGLIHISEASRSWVQDLQKEVDEGEKTVAQVIDTEDDSLGLSLKRVNDRQKRETMARWNKEQKAEKFLEDLSDKLGINEEEALEEIGFPMQREFGSAFHGFEISEAEENRLLEVFDEDTLDSIQEVARENIDMKKEKLEGEITLEFHHGDGLERVKDALKAPGEGVEIDYISAPRYAVTAWGRTQELAKKRMDRAIESVKEKTDNLDGKFEFSRA